MRRLAGVALVAGAIVVPSLSARADTRQVEIQDTQYEPAEVTITAGDTVTWSYFGTDSHSVSSDDGSFDSSPTCIAGINCMGNGSSYPHTFYSAGTFTYHCRVHAMTGTIIVEAAPTTTTSTTAPTTTSTSETTTSLASDQPTITQASLPSISSTARVALPKSILRAKQEDVIRPWVLAAIGIAGATTIAGIVLVRRGRVPLG